MTGKNRLSIIFRLKGKWYYTSMRSAKKFLDLEWVFKKIRKEYHFGKLSRKELAPNPWDQFADWFSQAISHKDPNINIMTLATSAKNVVTTRCVLLKGFDQRGLLFYSNTGSRKVKQLEINPRASLCFYWPTMERQVNIRGRVKKILREETENYFHSRPREAQIAAWCSRQSRVLKSRAELDLRFDPMRKKFEGCQIPPPPYWAGFRLKPEEFEFWQGRANRLNDRFRCRPAKDAWRTQRLEP